MKIKTGGGGIDKDGNAHRLPEQEIDAPDDWFERTLNAASELPRPDMMIVGPSVWAAFCDAAKR